MLPPYRQSRAQQPQQFVAEMPTPAPRRRSHDPAATAATTLFAPWQRESQTSNAMSSLIYYREMKTFDAGERRAVVVQPGGRESRSCCEKGQQRRARRTASKRAAPMAQRVFTRPQKARRAAPLRFSRSIAAMPRQRHHTTRDVFQNAGRLMLSPTFGSRYDTPPRGVLCRRPRRYAFAYAAGRCRSPAASLPDFTPSRDATSPAQCRRPMSRLMRCHDTAPPRRLFHRLAATVSPARLTARYYRCCRR